MTATPSQRSLPPKKSTTDRALQSAGFATVRAAFRLAEWTSPALGARWAANLWFRPPPNGHRRPSQQPPGTPFEAPLGDGRVLGELWGDGPPVYLLHGWGGHRGQLDMLVGPLVAAGHRVIAFDAPGHGASPPGPAGPRQSTLYEFADALTAAAAIGGPAAGLVAHSAGCVATAMAMRDGLAVPRVAFVAPPAGAASWIPVFAERLGLGQRVLARTIQRVEQRIGQPFSAFDLTTMAPQLAAGGSSLLLAHDRDDPETPWSDSKAVAAAWPGARLVSTTGLGHRRILRDPGVVAEITAFMDEAEAPPPR